MRVLSVLLLALTVALLLSVGFGSAQAAATDDPPEAGPMDVRIELNEDGDADWSIEHHYVLHDDADVEEFEAYAEEVRTGQRGPQNYRTTFERFVPYAQERTGREMAIENPGWESPEIRPIDEVDAFDEVEDDRLPENASVGTLRYSFTWRNFATVDDGRITLQDTFLTAAGNPWYGRLGNGERLIIEAPDDHDFDTVPHGIDSGMLVWTGPYEFAAGDFDIVIVRRSWIVGALLEFLPSLVGGLALLLVVVGSAWYVLDRREGSIELPIPPALSRDRGDRAAESGSNGRAVAAAGADAGDPDRTAAGTDGGDDAVGDATASGGAGASDDAAAVDPELLSDEERVTRMLKANGGRMKQAAIVKETGWSNAKVSQLLSKMDDDDDIEKLRIGRENLITLPDVDPTQIE